jgi:F0F1-type ATP synthase assembly protein I
MRKRTLAGRIAATVIAVLLCVLLSKLFGDSLWEVVIFFVISLFAGDFIAEWMERWGWFGRKR